MSSPAVDVPGPGLAVRRARPPDSSQVIPRRQCAGDWSFWYNSANSFLDEMAETYSRVLTAEELGAVAHDSKTASEMLCLHKIAHSAYELEGGLYSEVDELQLLQLQGIVLDAITEMQLALGRIAGNPVEALEAVDGHFELLLVGPSAPPASPAQQREALPHSSSGTGMCSAQSSGNYSVFSCGSSLTAVPSASSSGHRAASIDLGTLSQRGAAAACPAAAAAAGPRISVVSADATTRHLLHAMLSSSLDAVATPGGARASLSPPLPSVDADPSALAFTDVVVLHVAARMLPSFAIDADSLPRRPDGSLLGYILVGEFSAEFEDAISSSFAGWIETIRLPIRRGELVRRIRSVFVLIQAERGLLRSQSLPPAAAAGTAAPPAAGGEAAAAAAAPAATA